jgi:hypothetical protein
LTAATFRRNLDDDVRVTSSLVNGVGHCHDHLHQDDRRLGHQDHHRDDQHQDPQGRRQDDRRRDHRNCDLDHLGDQRQDHRLDDQRQEHLDALGRQCQLDRGRVHLREDGRYVRRHHHLDDQHQGHLGVGPLADDQLQGRLVVNCRVAVELDDCYLEAAEFDDHLVQYAAALVQQLVQLVQRIRPAQQVLLVQQVLLQVQLALLAQWVQLDALQQASQQGRRW